MTINTTPTQIFAEYEQGQTYNTAVELYDNVKKNEDFFIGKQWEGVKAPDLEKPVLNFLKRVVTYFISMLVSDDIGINFTLKNGGDDGICKILSDEVESIVEDAKAKAKNRDALRNACVDGDCAAYLSYDPDYNNGQLVSGRVVLEIIDNTNIIFGNPYRHEVQEQPYLLIVKRRKLADLREECKNPEIKPDSETNLYGEDAANDLVTVITKLYKDKGTVWFTSVTRDVVVKPPTNTGYKLYPVAYMSWEKIKNSYHGQAALTGLIPNQIFVNKLWAMAMRQVQSVAFPKIIYNQSAFPNGWSNAVGQAIGVMGDPNQAIANSFRGADMSSQVIELVDRTISMTRDFMGASDAALGNIKADNTSAIIAVQKASAAPLELNRLSFYQFIEDYVRVMVDIMRQHYGVRIVQAEDEGGNNVPVQFDFSAVDYDGLQLNVDVGSAAYWSELMQIQTADNLYTKGIIADAETYLESVPDQYIKGKDKIIAKLKEMEAAKIAMPQMQNGAADNGQLYPM